MEFETVVLTKVETVLGTPNKACFHRGSLCVDDVTDEEARSVFHTLTHDYGVEHVRISTLPGEFIFDFV